MEKDEISVPFFGVQREFKEIGHKYIEEFTSVLEHGKVLQGQEVYNFETEIAQFCDRSYGVAVNSGTDALFFALIMTGVQPGDEVLVTAFSFVASASCILRLGAVPVFVDIGYDYNMELSKAAQQITDRTRALIFVHLYGRMGHPEKIHDFASSHGLVCIEDAAQAFGAIRKGFHAGSLGQVSCLSFDPTKVIGAPGSGGMLLTDNSDIADQAKMLRYHGKNKSGQYESLGYNSQMPSATASILHSKFQHHDEWLARRRTIADLYSSNLKDCCQVPTDPDEGCHIYHKYVIRCTERDKVREKLNSQGIKTMIHYPSPLPDQPCFQSGDADNTYCPNAAIISNQVLSLPIHPFLRNEEINRIVDIIQIHAKPPEPISFI